MEQSEDPVTIAEYRIQNSISDEEIERRKKNATIHIIENTEITTSFVDETESPTCFGMSFHL